MSKWPLISDPYQRILSRGYKIDTNGCWNWSGGKNPKGYGVLATLKKDCGTYLVHRAMYIIKNGNIDPSLSVMHSCDNRGCINPDHLSAGTHQQNMLDMSLRMRMPNPRLDAAKVNEIRSRLGKESSRSIAKDYGVTSSTISQIKRNRTWKWVTENMEEINE